jgi:hypothetical protein
MGERTDVELVDEICAAWEALRKHLEIPTNPLNSTTVSKLLDRAYSAQDELARRHNQFSREYQASVKRKQ